MAQFYGEMQGNRGMTSRMGTKQSGIYGHIRGWNAGIRVYGDHENGVDVFRVYATSGSNGRIPDVLIATITDGPHDSMLIEHNVPKVVQEL